jgi:hypothetical protein
MDESYGLVRALGAVTMAAMLANMPSLYDRVMMGSVSDGIVSMRPSTRDPRVARRADSKTMNRLYKRKGLVINAYPR